jgi:flagellar assembly factor FliW
MPTLTVESSRFGTVEIDPAAVIEFPTGLIGLDGRRWAILSADLQGPFHWLHSLEDANLALPVANPWQFFGEYEVVLSDSDSRRVNAQEPEDVDVWVTVRAGSELSDFSANLRAPIVVCKGHGFQVINEATDAPVRAPLFPAAEAETAAA